MQELEKIPANRKGDLRFAILGVGNETRADDAAGVHIARRLKRRVKNRVNLLILECGPAPENFTGELLRFRPDVVLYIDAADFGEPPGTVSLVSADEIAAVAPSTHTLSPLLLFHYLSEALACACLMLAIQAGDAGLLHGLSPEVSISVAAVADELVDMLVSLAAGTVN